MIPNFYDSSLVITIISKHCKNQDDLRKIISACECMCETLETTPTIVSVPLTSKQLLAKAETYNLVNDGIIV